MDAQDPRSSAVGWRIKAVGSQGLPILLLRGSVEPVIPEAAVEAAIYAYGVDGKAHEWERKMIINILEAAAPHMHTHQAATRGPNAQAHR